MTAVTEIIRHYNNSILNSRSNKKRLLHCINKLYDLQITVNDLQVTRIGRTVSDLRKIDGEVGYAAKALIAKWKTMVVAETISSSESDGEDDNEDNDEPPSSHKNHHREDNVHKRSESSRKSEHNSHHKEDKNHSGSREHRKHNSDGHSSSDHKHRSSSDKHHSKERKEHHKTTTVTQSSEMNGRNGIGELGDDEENRLIIDIKNEEVKDVRDSKHHRSDRKDEKRTSSVNEHRSDKHKSSRNSDKIQHKSSEKVGHRSSSEKVSVSEKSNEKSSHHHHRKGEEKSGESSTSNKRKRQSEDSCSPGKTSGKDQANSSKHKKVKTETSTVDEIDSSMGTSFADALGMMMPKLSKTSKQKTPHKSAPSDIVKVSTVDTPKEKDKNRDKDKVKSKVSPSTSKSEKKAKDVPTQPPKLLTSTVKLPPLEPVIAVDFPIISNNYKPMPLNPTVMECVFNNYNQTQQPKKMMTDEEAFGSGISSKSMRTKVYSGVKSGAIAQIPSLYQMCIRILQKNIDALEQIGSIPFDILKPVLQLASPEQLFTIESYNPYLMEDTDILWEFHCKRKFRNLKRLELETWREMFLRCTEEQEARFNNLTNTIKKSQTVAVPLKTTKLAYVNSAVKPPRGVIKKQNQYGTTSKLVATPASRVAALNNVSNNIAKPGDVRLRVAAGLRDTAQVTSNSSSKTKSAAPLMQKSLQSFRSRFKR